MEIKISDKIATAAPNYFCIVMEADVVNAETPEALTRAIECATDGIKSVTEMSDINQRPAIRATREAYKALGKEPNRYRPSSEALCRRVVKGMGLYKINALVDLINLLSLESGYSIGGFDADKIVGDTMTLGVGENGEEFEGIGRGPLNIEFMPVFRDGKGGIGTPTSDHERTKLGLDTRRLVMTINVYGEEMPVNETIALAQNLLEEFADATNITFKIVRR